MTTIAVIPGDGIGPEVIKPALDVLGALGLGRGRTSWTMSTRKPTCAPERP
ncbi:hypothetical protein [Streptomyces sp. NPDC002952]|uniref:hypothetical protein n=1 Tax=Streptomyces sp. NPDC002952 TaxID=3364673 RepID=UPI00368EF924